MSKKISWGSLLLGFLIGYALHLSFTHPKSPLSNAFSFYYGSDMQ